MWGHISQWEQKNRESQIRERERTGDGRRGEDRREEGEERRGGGGGGGRGGGENSQQRGERVMAEEHKASVSCCSCYLDLK